MFLEANVSQFPYYARLTTKYLEPVLHASLDTSFRIINAFSQLSLIQTATAMKVPIVVPAEMATSYKITCANRSIPNVYNSIMMQNNADNVWEDYSLRVQAANEMIDILTCIIKIYR